MDAHFTDRRHKTGMVIILTAAMAGLCLTLLLCVLCVGKTAIMNKQSTESVELRIREPAGYWHWLVFEKYKSGISFFDRFEIVFYVNEYSALDYLHVSALQFIIDGKAYNADYRNLSTIPGIKGEKAYRLYFSVDRSCVDALAQGKSLTVRTIDTLGHFEEYSIPEPERFRQAVLLVL
jgi:hypothetical protein